MQSVFINNRPDYCIDEKITLAFWCVQLRVGRRGRDAVPRATSGREERGADSSLSGVAKIMDFFPI